MPNINIVVLGGNMTRDVETRYTPKGTAVGEFGLAINRKWRTEGGDLKEEVSFFDCSAYGVTAENITKYFHKGSPIIVQGRLKQESWDDKQTGQKRSKVKLIVETFHFASDKAHAGGSASDNDGGSRSGIIA